MSPIGFCEECGAELEAGAKFCEKCGKPVTIGSEPAAAPPAGIPPLPPQPVIPHPVASRPQPAPRPIPTPTPQYSPTPTPMPVSVQPPAKKSGSKIFIIAIVCIVVLCGLVAAALGLGWFTTQAGLVNISFSDSPSPTETKIILVPTAIPTAIPPTVAVPTDIPKISVSKYLSRIGALLGTYITEFEKFQTLFEKADVATFKDAAWRNDTYAAFDGIIEAAGNVANEPSPVEYATFKADFAKAYEEFKAAKPDLHNGIDNIDTEALGSFTAHLKKANDFVDQANAAMPQSDVAPTKAAVVDKEQYLSRVISLLKDFNNELKNLSSRMGEVSDTSFSDTAWKNGMYSSLDKIIDISNKMAIEPCPPEYQVFKDNMEKAHTEYKAASPDLHTGLENVDSAALTSFNEHIDKAKGFIDQANAAFRKLSGEKTTSESVPVTTAGQAGARDLIGFSDDFSSESNTWKIVSDAGNGTAIIKNGELNLTVTKPDKYLSVQVPWYLTKPVTDVSLSVTATVRTPEMGYFGLFCRALDKNNFYMISIRPKVFGSGEYRFYKNLNGVISYLNDWEYTTALNGGEIPEQVTFSCRGTKLRLEVNGKLVDEVSDSDIKSGSAHLFALSMSDVTAANPYKISFDNFEATIP